MKDYNLDLYIELMYSQTSKLNKIENLQQRKDSAAKQAGLDPTVPNHRDIIELNNTHTNEKIFNYINQHNSNDFILLLAKQQLFWRIKEKIMVHCDDMDEMVKQCKLAEQCDELVPSIEKLYLKIYKEESVIEQVAKPQIRMRSPEQRIKKVEKANV